MADDSLTERNSAFNQSSLDDAEFQISESTSKIELAVSLLGRVQALVSVALKNGLSECSDYERHCYLETLDEMVTAAIGQLDDVLIKCRSMKKKAKRKQK